MNLRCCGNIIFRLVLSFALFLQVDALIRIRRLGFQLQTLLELQQIQQGCDFMELQRACSDLLSVSVYAKPCSKEASIVLSSVKTITKASWMISKVSEAIKVKIDACLIDLDATAAEVHEHGKQNTEKAFRYRCSSKGQELAIELEFLSEIQLEMSRRGFHISLMREKSFLSSFGRFLNMLKSRTAGKLESVVGCRVPISIPVHDILHVTGRSIANINKTENRLLSKTEIKDSETPALKRHINTNSENAQKKPRVQRTFYIENSDENLSLDRKTRSTGKTLRISCKDQLKKEEVNQIDKCFIIDQKNAEFHEADSQRLLDTVSNHAEQKKRNSFHNTSERKDKNRLTLEKNKTKSFQTQSIQSFSGNSITNSYSKYERQYQRQRQYLGNHFQQHLGMEHLSSRKKDDNSPDGINCYASVQYLRRSEQGSTSPKYDHHRYNETDHSRLLSEGSSGKTISNILSCGVKSSLVITRELKPPKGDRKLQSVASLSSVPMLNGNAREEDRRCFEAMLVLDELPMTQPLEETTPDEHHPEVDQCENSQIADNCRNERIEGDILEVCVGHESQTLSSHGVIEKRNVISAIPGKDDRPNRVELSMEKPPVELSLECQTAAKRGTSILKPTVPGRHSARILQQNINPSVHSEFQVGNSCIDHVATGLSCPADLNIKNYKLQKIDDLKLEVVHQDHALGCHECDKTMGYCSNDKNELCQPQLCFQAYRALKSKNEGNNINRIKETTSTSSIVTH